MTYNDFPIMNDDTYKLLNEQYLKNSKFDKKEFLFNICNKLNLLININFSSINRYNSKILNSINLSKNTIQKILTNLTATFNILPTNNKELTSCNLFSYLSHLTKTASMFSIWLTNETKEYFKIVAQKSLTEILDCVSKILNSIDESNILFFKHM